MSEDNRKHWGITDKILFAFYKRVYAELGTGFLEKVYENALKHELRNMGLRVEQQPRIDVYYAGVLVGEYYADLVVENQVIVELKAVSKLANVYDAQLLNYLRATHFEVGLLLNFGKKPEHKRRIYSNDRKKHLT